MSYSSYPLRHLTHGPIIAKSYGQRHGRITGTVKCSQIVHQTHRLSINRPTKRGKEKSRSDGHCQREKEMDDHILTCQQILKKEPHSDTQSLRASIIFDINDISFFGTPDYHHCCSIAKAGMLIL
jgi:hypothetical protein